MNAERRLSAKHRIGAERKKVIIINTNKTMTERFKEKLSAFAQKVVKLFKKN